MKEIATKIDNDPSSAGKLTASEFNHIPSEIENAIKPFMNLDENDNTQLFKSIVQLGKDGSIPLIANLADVDKERTTTVNVKGYYEENDGGGGVFNYDDAQSAINNGGTIINGWVRQYSGKVNSKWFGTFEDFDIGSGQEIEGDIELEQGIEYVNDSNILIRGNINSKVTNASSDNSTFTFSGDGQNRLKKPLISNTNIIGQTTGTSNGNGAIKLRATESAKVLFNDIVSYEGIRSGYGDASLGDYTGNPATENQPLRQCKDTVIIGNNVTVNNMGIELIASTGSSVLANTIKGTDSKAGSNGIRLTGYPGMPNNNTSIVGNKVISKLTGVSVQSASKYNTISALQIDDCYEGVQQIDNVTYTDYWSSFNNIQAIANDCVTGFRLYNYNNSKLDAIADNCSSGVSLYNNDSVYGVGKNCIVDAIVSNCSSDGMYLSNHNNSIFRIVMSEITRYGLRLNGDRNIIDIVLDDAGQTNFPIDIQGNNNIIRIVQDVSTTIQSWDINVVGNDNDITVNNVKKVYISGTGNKLNAINLDYLRLNETVENCYIAGSIAEFKFDTINEDLDKINLSNLACSFRGKLSTETTDASGQYTMTFDNIPTGLVDYYASIVAHNVSAKVFSIDSISIATNTLTIVATLYNIADGTISANTGFNARYEIFPLAV